MARNSKLVFGKDDIEEVIKALRTNKAFSIFADASAVSTKQVEQNEIKERFESASVVELLPLLESGAQGDHTKEVTDRWEGSKLCKLLFKDSKEVADELFDFKLDTLAPSNKFLDNVLLPSDRELTQIQEMISGLEPAVRKKQQEALDDLLKKENLRSDTALKVLDFELQLEKEREEEYGKGKQKGKGAGKGGGEGEGIVASEIEQLKALIAHKDEQLAQKDEQLKLVLKEWKSKLEKHHFEQLKQANAYVSRLWVDVKQHLFGLRYEVLRLQGEASYKLDFMEIATLLAAQLADLVSDVLFYIGTVNGAAFKSAATYNTVEPSALFVLVFSACFFIVATSYLLSVRCRAAEAKLTQAETARFRASLMWVQFKLALLQILSEDVPQTMLNFHISHATHRFTTTAIISGLVSLAAAAGILGEVTRRIYAAKAKAKKIAIDRRVSEFTASGTHVAVDSDKSVHVIVDKLFTCSNPSDCAYCCIYFWKHLADCTCRRSQRSAGGTLVGEKEQTQPNTSTETATNPLNAEADGQELRKRQQNTAVVI